MLFAVAVAVAFVSGVRSTFRLWRRYRAVVPVLTDARERLLLRSFVAVSTAITLAAGFYGLLAVRRLVGFPPFEWGIEASALVAIGVLFIPAALDHAVERVARR